MRPPSVLLETRRCFTARELLRENNGYVLVLLFLIPAVGGDDFFQVRLWSEIVREQLEFREVTQGVSDLEDFSFFGGCLICRQRFERIGKAHGLSRSGMACFGVLLVGE